MVTWHNKKQSVVARGSTKAKFRVITQAICEVIWIKRVLKELRISSLESMKIFCDNEATIRIIKNPVHHDRTNHVKIDCHFIKEKIESGIVQMVDTPT